MMMQAARAACAVLLAASAASASLLPGRRHIGALNELLASRGVDVMAEALTDDGALYFDAQLVDHFNYADDRQWSQKYYLNDEFHDGGDGPVFLMLGGEGPISASYNGDHFNVLSLAKEHGAMMVSIEHRFYSANASATPAEDSDANLYLLSTEQALADTAAFIEYINEQRALDGAKWITFGGSYSGAMSLWMRAKYPALVAGAWGTSGPVQPQTDFQRYMETVQDSLGASCAARLRNASDELAALLHTRTGRAQASKLFSACDGIETSADAITFYSNVAGVVSGVVQYNNDNNKYQPFNISTMCSMLGQRGSALEALAGVMSRANAFSGASCVDSSYEGYVAELKQTGAGRSWTYQTCAAFGFFQAADASPSRQPFNETFLPLEFYFRLCADVYGDAVPARPDNNRVAVQFGSLAYRADNVFAPNGDVDPWHNLGLLQGDLGANSAHVLIHGTAHCADLYPPRAEDLPGLTAARAQGNALLTKWLA